MRFWEEEVEPDETKRRKIMKDESVERLDSAIKQLKLIREDDEEEWSPDSAGLLATGINALKLLKDRAGE
ncbi:hypothetical protein AKJ65_08140 [candidate division MSBL1 archaeon SCGC-AAA259E19]|uniref:Uncharacterized protein n=1 Tax=candidate division MSBL1 archaeon SCGC-AAA259E19 TaxID=1698264 RepID=A0A133UCW9_9EURY|nr:hypothetical protein AKJ65_08140 [candidate division MSBL1 archaeon SCGC-AAA259E19]